MSRYIRKTRDEYHVMANYGYGDGWEHEGTEDTPQEARARLEEYRAEAPQFLYRVVHKQVKLTQED